MAAAAAAALLVVVAAPRCAAQATSGCLAPCPSFTAGEHVDGASCCSALEGVVRGAPRCSAAAAWRRAGSPSTPRGRSSCPASAKVQTPLASQCHGVVRPACYYARCGVDDRRITVGSVRGSCGCSCVVSSGVGDPRRRLRVYLRAGGHRRGSHRAATCTQHHSPQVMITDGNLPLHFCFPGFRFQIHATFQDELHCT